MEVWSPKEILKNIQKYLSNIQNVVLKVDKTTMENSDIYKKIEAFLKCLGPQSAIKPPKFKLKAL